ncbi:MAG: baseplate J/gp47 family protein [Clostridiales bacterium]|nr:baseplate J/gp47 family protein [Clostridiales bacterium]
METYNEIYERMKEEYTAESGSQFDNASDIAIRLRVLAGEIYNAQVNAEWLKNQMFVSTAGGEYLDYFASQRGLERKAAAKAQGEITFYIDEVKDHDIIIPQGSVVATTDGEPVRFCTTEQEEISAGNTLVSVYAEAEKAGKSGNIEIGKAVTAVSVPSEIDSVTNRTAFSGGVDEETDDELRERIASTFKSPSNGTNAAYYEQLVLSVEGISKAGVVSRARGTGTVDIYVYGDGSAVSAAAVSQAQDIVDENRELNVDAQVIAASPREYDMNVLVYAKSGYSNLAVRQACTQAFESYLESLPIGGTLYLSGLGRYLMDTECIENYRFSDAMSDTSASSSQCFVSGDVEIEVG